MRKNLFLENQKFPKHEDFWKEVENRSKFLGVTGRIIRTKNGL